MPRILFDHECRECGHLFEELVEREGNDTVTCPSCSATDITRLITGGRIDPKLGVNASDFPTMGDKWARVRIQRQKIEAKRARDNGPD